MHRDAELDFDPFARRLRLLAEQEGWSLAVEARVGSTNESVCALVESAAGPSATPAVAVAAEQSAGVGRRGARWLSTAGDGLWFSLVVPAAAGLPETPPGLALAARLAAVLQGYGVPAVVKWPNDLYLHGDGRDGRDNPGKLGGLMIQRRRLAGEICWLAGVGVNWRRPSQSLDADYSPAALGEVLELRRDDSIALALALIRAAVDVMGCPADWLVEVERVSRMHLALGRAVELEHGDGRCEKGIAGAIRPDGDLEITLSDGRVVRAGALDRVRLLA
ncbi:MAG: biotin--[acetyl-CoA-carboxylase] ligase [Guyparkeria sp.]